MTQIQRIMVRIGLVAGAALIVAACVSSSNKNKIVCDEYDENRIAFFGDTHVHTSLSFDARSQGTIATHDDAYAFARGEEIGLVPLDDQGNPLASGIYFYSLKTIKLSQTKKMLLIH